MTLQRIMTLSGPSLRSCQCDRVLFGVVAWVFHHPSVCQKYSKCDTADKDWECRAADHCEYEPAATLSFVEGSRIDVARGLLALWHSLSDITHVAG